MRRDLTGRGVLVNCVRCVVCGVRWLQVIAGEYVQPWSVEEDNHLVGIAPHSHARTPARPYVHRWATHTERAD